MKRSLFFAFTFFFLALNCEAQKQKVSFRDSTDGAVDLSEFLLSVSGFLPVPVLITEPAIGYGGGLFGAYFHKKESTESTISRPDISIGGAGFTENGTWFAGGGHLGFWKNDRIRYRGFLFHAQPNLTFYRFQGLPNEIAIDTELQFWFLLQSLSFRIGKSKWFAGADYIYYSSQTRFAEFGNAIVDEILSRLEKDLVNSGVGAKLFYDSRDNIYTPNKGVLWDNQLRYYPEWLGTTQAYGTFTTDLKWFFPVYKDLVHLAIANNFSFVFDNAPFFANPFVNMRGIKAMRYQGEAINTLQAEARFNVYKRWSLVGFGGLGIVSPTLQEFDFSENVWAGGTGFRYTLARLFGLQAGLDFAWSQKDPLTGENQFIFYIVTGTNL